MVDWNAAQNMEEQTWKDVISSSPMAVYEELADAAEFTRFIENYSGDYHRAVDVGVGPLGLGWIAVFGRGTPDDLVGIEPLPRLEPSTGSPELDQFMTALQRRITYVRGRAEDELLPGASFDLVVCDNVIDHTEHPERVLAECKRLMTSGGTLAFGVNVFSTVGHLKWTRYTRVRHPKDPNTIMHPHSYTEKTVERLLASTGWRIRERQQSTPLQRLAGRAYRHRVIASPT
jgi:SAM-dependent methyltransferase